MRSYADRAPSELLDPDGEGVYVRARPGDRALPHAVRLLGCHWREIDMTAVAMVPNEDQETWRSVGFRNWRWRLWPLSTEPAIFLYCVPALTDTKEVDRG